MNTKAAWFSLALLVFASIGASASPVDVVSASLPVNNAAPAPSSALASESLAPSVSTVTSSQATRSASPSSSGISTSSGASVASSTSRVSASTSSSASAAPSTASSSSSSTLSEKSSAASSVSASSTGSTATTTSSAHTLAALTSSSRTQNSASPPVSPSSSHSSLSSEATAKPISTASETSGLSTGAIVGITFGVVAGLIALAVGLVCFYKKRQRRRRYSEAGQYLRGSDNAWGYSDVKSPAPPAGILGRSRSHSPPLSGRYAPVANEMDEVAPHSRLQISVPTGSSAEPNGAAAAGGREERLARMKSYRTSSTASFYPTSEMLPTPSDDDLRSPFYSASPEEENPFVSTRYADDRSIAETMSIYSTNSYELHHSRRTSTGPETPRGPRATLIA